MIFDWYLEHEFAFAATQLALAMFGMGAKLTFEDFVSEFRTPRSFAIGMAIQLIAVPLLAVSIANLLGLNAGVTTGLVLVAAVPGGTISNVVTYFARGNIALSIALTTVTTIACLATTPFIMQLLAAASLPGEFTMPTGQIAFDIALCLLTPLALGMYFGRRFPDHRDAISNRAIQLSVGVIVLMIIGASGAGRVDPLEQGVAAIASVTVLAVAAQLTALAVSSGTGLPARDRTAIAIEVTIRNSNLALMIKASLFPAVPGVPDPFADAVLYIALMYGGVALPLALPLVAYQRRQGSSEKTPSTQ